MREKSYTEKICASPDKLSDNEAVPNSSKKILYLIDGTAYVYRAFHAFNLSTASGEPTGAVYGMVNMLNRILKEQSPHYIVTIFDAKGKTFRDDMYPEYKANRPPMPDELRRQYDIIRDLVPAMGIPVLSVPGVEADDVIATLATEAANQNNDIHTIIASADKDLAQLVSEHITLRDEMRNDELDPEGVLNKFGVSPDRIIDYLSLVGDPVDNIPGVPLVGKKTAAKWIQQYGSLEGVISNADNITGKAGENLRNSFEQLGLAKNLVTLKLDVDIEFNMNNFTQTVPDTEVLRDYYKKLEFRTWLSQLKSSKATEEHKSDYFTILDESSLNDLVEQLKNCQILAVDTETTGINVRKDSLVGISISMNSRKAYYIPVAHRYVNAPKQLPRELVLEKLAPILEDESIAKIAQNIKFDAAIFRKYGVSIKGVLYDTMLESYVLDSRAVAQHSLDNLASRYLQYSTIPYEEVAGKGKNQITFDQVEVERAVNYAAEDADITLQLHQTLWPKLESNSSLKNVYENIEVPLIAVLDRMENNGVLLNCDELRRQSMELQVRLNKVENSIFELAGTQFNLSSPKQIQEVLFDKLSLPVTKKTSRGQPSTSEDVLRDLSDKYEVPKLILEHRGLFKLKSTYTDKLPDLIDQNSGRVHTSYHQAVAATGRLSSSDPNLQNIPIRTPEGKRVREAFVADSECVLLSIDYSQIELRLMAHLSGDPGLVDAFNRGGDVHKSTASEVFGTSEEEVTPDQRRNAKAINFGLIYGMSQFGLARQLGIEQAQAKEYVQQYFERYPGVREYMDRIRAQAYEQKFVETLFGRRLYVRDIESGNFNRRQHAERTAINAPLQGSAADIIKMAMIEVDKWLAESESGAKMIMQVHDELVLEVPEKEIDEVISKVSHFMENIAELDVPLIVDSGVGINWAQAHD